MCHQQFNFSRNFLNKLNKKSAQLTPTCKPHHKRNGSNIEYVLNICDIVVSLFCDCMNNKFWLPLLASVYTACNKAVALRSSLQFNRVLHKRIIMSALVHSSDGKVDVLSGDSTDATVLKPIAKSIPHDVYYGINPNDLDELRGDAPMDPPKIRSDPFYWLRDQTRSDKEVLAHLEHENKYCEQELSHLAGLRGSLYDEMISHLKETDEDVPHRHGDYMYYSKTSKGLSYTIHCRKAIAASVDSSSISSSCSSDVVILDENKLAEEHDYTDVGMLVPSPSHNRVAYTVDHSGYETYSLRVIEDVEANRCSEDVIEDVDSTIVWGADDSVLFYLTLDDQHRPHKLFLHRLGTKQEDDLCLFTESDDKFWMSIGKTNDDKFLILSLSSTETSECYAIDLTDAEGATSHADAVIDRMVCLRKREFGVRYDVEHHGSHFYFVTNIDHAKNNKLMRSPSANYSSTTAWKDVRPYQAHEQIDDIIPFKNHIAVLGRESGIQRLWIMKMMIIDEQNGEEEQLLQWEAVPFPEITYSIHDGDNYVYDSSVIRLTYTSLVTPKQTLDYDMSTGEVTILKQTEVPLYDRDSYECRRIVATVRDGTQVPMSMVYHKKILQGECQRRLVDNPVLLYGYGSYGVCIDPSFDFKRISLLDRGVVFVIAHIRGEEENDTAVLYHPL